MAEPHTRNRSWDHDREHDREHARDRAQGLVLVTDFDGTLYRGDDPIRYYAAQAAHWLAREPRRSVVEGVDRYLADGAADLPDAVDGWEAVAVLGRRHGLDQHTLDAAFTATRLHMLQPGCSLEVPAGYAELLTELRAEGVRVVLATNSPAAGLDALLRRLGVLPLVDDVVSGTGKPAGLARLLRRELGLAESTPAWQVPSEAGARLLVIGDHWRNDIQPGVEVGAIGAYIDRFGRADGRAHSTAPTIEDLLDTVRNWADARSLAERN